MYRKLGVAWASSLLGFVSLAMAVFPFVFLRYGRLLRERSQFREELLRENKRLTGEKGENGHE